MLRTQNALLTMPKPSEKLPFNYLEAYTEHDLRSSCGYPMSTLLTATSKQDIRSCGT